jgi:DNA-directed RNA polymerase beta subunit
MEVWALEAYGAVQLAKMAVKSDDVAGRTRMKQL